MMVSLPKSVMRHFFHNPESSDMVFDPDQNPMEKRAIRQNYRSLAKKIEGIRIFNCPFTISLHFL